MPAKPSAAPLARPTGDTLVNDALNATPAAIAVFLGRRMHCVGCPVNALHSLAEAAEEHRVPLADLIADLRRAGTA